MKKKEIQSLSMCRTLGMTLVKGKKKVEGCSTN